MSSKLKGFALIGAGAFGLWLLSKNANADTDTSGSFSGTNPGYGLLPDTGAQAGAEPIQDSGLGSVLSSFLSPATSGESVVEGDTKKTTSTPSYTRSDVQTFLSGGGSVSEVVSSTGSFFGTSSLQDPAMQNESEARADALFKRINSGGSSGGSSGSTSKKSTTTPKVSVSAPHEPVKNKKIMKQYGY